MNFLVAQALVPTSAPSEDEVFHLKNFKNHRPVPAFLLFSHSILNFLVAKSIGLWSLYFFYSNARYVQNLNLSQTTQLVK